MNKEKIYGTIGPRKELTQAEEDSCVSDFTCCAIVALCPEQRRCLRIGAGKISRIYLDVDDGRTYSKHESWTIEYSRHGFVVTDVDQNVTGESRAMADWLIEISRMQGISAGIFPGTPGPHMLYRGTGAIWVGAFTADAMSVLCAALYAAHCICALIRRRHSIKDWGKGHEGM